MYVPKKFYENECTPEFLGEEDRILYNNLLKLWGSAFIAKFKFSKKIFCGIKSRSTTWGDSYHMEEFHLGDFCVSSNMDTVKIGNFFLVEGDTSIEHIKTISSEKKSRREEGDQETTKELVEFKMVVFVLNCERFLV